MSVFKRTTLTTLVAAALGAGAMARYPGGTAHDRSSVGYSLSRNFLSDLGMTVAYNGAPNRLGSALFVASLLLLVVGLGASVWTIVAVLRRERASRQWAMLAGMLMLLACVAFAGVAVTPENRVMAVHVAFTFWGWRFVALVGALMTVASFRSTLFRRQATVAWLATTIVLAAYAAMLDWGPRLDTPAGFATQVIAQKVATCVIMIGLIYVAREADRARV